MQIFLLPVVTWFAKTLKKSGKTLAVQVIGMYLICSALSMISYVGL